MDWELKIPHPWEFAEMEQNADPGCGFGPGPMLGQGGGGGLSIRTNGGSGRLDCSVDLKLGGPAEKWKEQLVMDWELKMPHPWEFAEMEQNADPGGGIGPGPMLGQGGGGLSIRTSGRLDCSVDLKLGGLGDFGGPADKWKEQHHHHHHHHHGASTVSSSGSSKRARAPSNSSQNVSCLVDGCKSDLSGCREYHRRHKVCEGHSKTPIVLVGGQEQRFCQQCSRFHLLVEFDEVKRSCRKRLDGHNRRRRKPQPSDSINSGSLFTNHHGSRYSSYPQIFPTAASDSPWPVTVKTEDEPLYPHHPPVHFLDRQLHHLSSSFARSVKEGKHFPFLQDSDRATLESSICQPLLKSISSAESSSSNKIFDCALSLLSSSSQTSSINLGQIVPSADRIPMGQPLLSYGGGLGLGRYSGSDQASDHVSMTGFSCSGMEDEHVGSTVLVSDGSDPEMNCHGLFAVGGEGSSDVGSHALPFSWQ